METRYVTITVRKKAKTEAPKAKQEKTAATWMLGLDVMFGVGAVVVAMLLTFIFVVSMTNSSPAMAEQAHPLVVEKGLTRPAPYIKAKTEFSSKEVTELTNLVLMVEGNKEEVPAELVEPRVQEVVEIPSEPTIAPVEERDSYALRHFADHDQGSSEHVEDLGEFTLTFYCTCKKCCGKDPGDPAYGITRSGTHVQEGRTIAVDPSVIPLGQEVYIEGYGTFTAEDTGSGVGNKHIDIYVSDHQEALYCGVESAEVYV